MYSRNSFGSYYPIDSQIHRLNSVVKLFNFLLMILLMCLTSNLEIMIMASVLLLCMIILSYIPLRFYLKTIWTIRYVYFLIAFLCYFLNQTGTDTIIYLIKLTIVIEYLNVLALTTSPSESIYSIEKLISYVNLLYLPLSHFAFKVNELLRYIPLVSTLDNEVYKAAQSRGMDYYNSNIIKKIFIYLKTHENRRKQIKDYNKNIKQFRELRLFDFRIKRTNYRTNNVGFNDLFYVVMHLILIFAHLVESGVITL